jgi:xanthine/CO dehydrogenase XdhC/CoxF family maturation factor
VISNTARQRVLDTSQWQSRSARADDARGTTMGSQERPTVQARVARLVLVTPDGSVVGCLPPIPVALPWWQEVESVVQAAREHHDIEVTILRLLESARGRPQGGEVTYLAEVAKPVPADRWAGTIETHSLRRHYAEPGGPATDLDLGNAGTCQPRLGTDRKAGPGSQLEPVERLAYPDRRPIGVAESGAAVPGARGAASSPRWPAAPFRRCWVGMIADASCLPKFRAMTCSKLRCRSCFAW